MWSCLALTGLVLGLAATACSTEPDFGDGTTATATASAGSTASGSSSGGPSSSSSASMGSGGEATSASAASTGSAGGEGGAGGDGDGGDGGAASGGRGGAGGEGGSEPVCGNDVVEGDESCDDDSAFCDSDCRFACPEGSVAASSYDACYVSAGFAGTFFEAFDACAALELLGAGARLPTPRTADDLAILATMGIVGNKWTAATDLAVEGDFTWVDEASAFPFESLQLPWSGGNPDNGGDREDCVVVLDNGQLNDTGCDTTHGILCEIVPDWAITSRCGNGVPDLGEECDSGSPTALHGLECEGCNLRCPGDGWSESPLDHVCFVLLNPSSTLGSATADCAAQGARLATPDDIGDVAVSRYVCDQASTDDCWLGGGRASLNEEFTWQSGEPFDYVANAPPWKSNEPGTVGLALIMESALLNVVDIDGAHGALCELGDEDQ